jgi:hypothetical protein
MNQQQTIIITVSDPSSDNELRITMNRHSNVDDWILTFKTILIHQTFNEDTVKDLFSICEEK